MCIFDWTRTATIREVPFDDLTDAVVEKVDMFGQPTVLIYFDNSMRKLTKVKSRLTLFGIRSKNHEKKKLTHIFRR